MEVNITRFMSLETIHLDILLVAFRHRRYPKQEAPVSQLAPGIFKLWEPEYDPSRAEKSPRRCYLGLRQLRESIHVLVPVYLAIHDNVLDAITFGNFRGINAMSSISNILFPSMVDVQVSLAMPRSLAKNVRAGRIKASIQANRSIEVFGGHRGAHPRLVDIVKKLPAEARLQAIELDCNYENALFSVFDVTLYVLPALESGIVLTVYSKKPEPLTTKKEEIALVELAQKFATAAFAKNQKSLVRLLGSR